MAFLYRRALVKIVKMIQHHNSTGRSHFRTVSLAAALRTAEEMVEKA